MIVLVGTIACGALIVIAVVSLLFPPHRPEQPGSTRRLLRELERHGDT